MVFQAAKNHVHLHGIHHLPHVVYAYPHERVVAIAS